MVARKRRVTRKVDRRTGGWALFHSKREPEREAERARVRQERAERQEKAEKERKSKQAQEIARNKQRAAVYASRAAILEQKHRARTAGRKSRAAFWGGGKSLSTRHKIGGKSISFW